MVVGKHYCSLVNTANILFGCSQAPRANISRCTNIASVRSSIRSMLANSLTRSMLTHCLSGRARFVKVKEGALCNVGSQNH